MTIKLEKFGALDEATVRMGRFTLLCGKNNTGKSYLTYSLYGILSYLRSIEAFVLPEGTAGEFLSKGVCSVDLEKFAEVFWLKMSAERKQKMLSNVPGWLGRATGVTTNSSVDFIVSDDDISEIKRRLKSFSCSFVINGQEEYSLRIEKQKDSSQATCTYIPGKSKNAIYTGADLHVPPSAVRNAQWVMAFLVQDRLPRPFIIGSERTGISVFRDEFSLYRDLAYEDSNVSEKLRTLRDRFSFSGYPIATRRDMAFVLQLAQVVREKKSFLTTKRGGLILSAFEDIIDGHYDIDQETGAISFTPRNLDSKLSLHESSSSVRALCELYFYLAYCAKRGDILVIDEPEMNLHPSAQRRLARLFAMLTNMDIRVFVTTHSDYFLREINALVRVESLPEARRNEILTSHGIHSDALIKSADVAIYVVNEGGAEQMKSHPQYGFAVKSFDDTIEQFNALYSDVCDAMEDSDERRVRD